MLYGNPAARVDVDADPPLLRTPCFTLKREIESGESSRLRVIRAFPSPRRGRKRGSHSGIPAATPTGRCKLEWVGRGLYALPGAHTSEFLSFAEVSKKDPNAVICLISALQFHEVTTQVDHRVWIAIENRRWAPVFEHPPSRSSG